MCVPFIHLMHIYNSVKSQEVISEVSDKFQSLGITFLICLWLNFSVIV